MSLLGGRARQLLGGAVLAALAALFFAPSPARAECGDYVVLGSHAMGGPRTAAGRGVLPMGAFSERHQLPPASPAPHFPCSGPSCRHSPPQAPSAPVPTAPVRSQEWGHLAAAIAIGASGLDSLRQPMDYGRPTHRGPAIYHPPRSA
jgi:hypothetical protein